MDTKNTKNVDLPPTTPLLSGHGATGLASPASHPLTLGEVWVGVIRPTAAALVAANARPPTGLPTGTPMAALKQPGDE